MFSALFGNLYDIDSHILFVIVCSLMSDVTAAWVNGPEQISHFEGQS